MDCKKIEQKLIFYIEGDLSPAESQLISQHITNCEECASKLEYLENSFQMIVSVKSIELKPFLYTRIKARMEQNAPTIRRWAFAPLAIASVLTVGLFFGSLVSKITISKNTAITQAEYDVAYIFNDAQIERAEYKLLNE